jgi:hypothetical protein
MNWCFMLLLKYGDEVCLNPVWLTKYQGWTLTDGSKLLRSEGTNVDDRRMEMNDAQQIITWNWIIIQWNGWAMSSAWHFGNYTMAIENHQLTPTSKNTSSLSIFDTTPNTARLVICNHRHLHIELWIPHLNLEINGWIMLMQMTPWRIFC